MQHNMESDELAMHGQLLLDNPVFQMALEEVRNGIGREMDNAGLDDVKTHQALVLMRQAANRVVQHVIGCAQSGKIEQFNAKRRKGRF